jgi:hypothetical protein
MCFVRSHNKQRLLPYTILADWFCVTEVESVYCTYALSPYIKQTRLVFKGLMVVMKIHYNSTNTSNPHLTVTENYAV